MRAFSLIELLLVVALITTLLAIVVVAGQGTKRTAHVTSAAVEQRGRINQAVAEGRIRDQKTLDREMRRAKRMTEQGLKQGN